MEQKLDEYREEKLQLWDCLGDDTEVYVPTVWNSEKTSKSMFVELPDPKDKSRMIAMVFLNREDAGKYRERRARENLSFIKTTLGKLYNSLTKFFGKNPGKKFECMLSTVDVRGNFCHVDTLWSNQSQS